MADPSGRVAVEISLLESMYPGQVKYDSRAREVKYGFPSGSFLLRLPDGYLEQTNAIPELLSASVGDEDIRGPLKQRIDGLVAGDEVLDSIISSFDELAQEIEDRADASNDITGQKDEAAAQKATVIVWLHHLLNTKKRKLALSPSSSGISGVTKPGYPGVLLYSGLASAVHEHVNELKQQNWQAFQIRLEDEEEWSLAHGAGVVEVEAMKEIVADIGEARKDRFMEAMRMK